MTVTIGYWAIPLAITCAGFLWFGRQGRGDDFGVEITFKLFLVLIVSLVAWLIWAVLT